MYKLKNHLINKSAHLLSLQLFIICTITAKNELPGNYPQQQQ